MSTPFRTCVDMLQARALARTLTLTRQRLGPTNTLAILLVMILAARSDAISVTVPANGSIQSFVTTTEWRPTDSISVMALGETCTLAGCEVKLNGAGIVTFSDNPTFPTGTAESIVYSYAEGARQGSVILGLLPNLGVPEWIQLIRSTQENGLGSSSPTLAVGTVRKLGDYGGFLTEVIPAGTTLYLSTADLNHSDNSRAYDVNVEIVEGLRWKGDQATCDGSNSPPVGSFFDAAMWESGAPQREGINPTVIFEAVDTSGVPNPSTVFSAPRRIHFGDIDVTPMLGCINRQLVRAGNAVVSGLEIRNSDWTFDFGAFDNYIGIGDFDARESGSLLVTEGAQIHGSLALENGTMSTGQTDVHGRLAVGRNAMLQTETGIDIHGTLEVFANAAVKAATIEIYSGGTLDLCSSLLLGHTPHVEAHSILVNRGGNIECNGRLTGNVVVEGLVSPSPSQGALHVDGDFTLSSSGRLRLVIEPPATDTILLSVSGSTNIQGAVQLHWEDGFVPSAGQQFEILSSGGSINTTNATFVSTDQFIVDSMIRDGNLSIRILASPDLNGDHNVDGADVATMFSTWGSSGRSDLNGDGVVDAADAGVMFSAWTGDRPSALVPEPTSFLFVVGAVALHIWSCRCLSLPVDRN